MTPLDLGSRQHLALADISGEAGSKRAESRSAWLDPAHSANDAVRPLRLKLVAGLTDMPLPDATRCWLTQLFEG